MTVSGRPAEMWREAQRKAREAAESLRSVVREPPACVVVLGSGLSAAADRLGAFERVPYGDIPHFPVATVPGHPGTVAWEPGRRALLLEGRSHMYEGLSPWEVVFPLRVVAELGRPVLILTNSAGALDTSFAPGDLMLITDHINLTGANALVGLPPDAQPSPFVDMSSTYDRELRVLARQAAGELGLRLREGVYVGLLGPSYETPAEIHFLRAIGGDAVGMSTVLEAVAGRHLGMRILGLSLLTNKPLTGPTSHEEVVRVGREGGVGLIGLVDRALDLLEAGIRQ